MALDHLGDLFQSLHVLHLIFEKSAFFLFLFGDVEVLDLAFPFVQVLNTLKLLVQIRVALLAHRILLLGPLRRMGEQILQRPVSFELELALGALVSQPLEFIFEQVNLLRGIPMTILSLG